MLIGKVISEEGLPVIFVMEEADNYYSFHFIVVDEMLPENRRSISLVPDEAGYLHGMTSDGSGIAIFIQNKIMVRGVYILNTWIYFSTGNGNCDKCIEMFDSIYFRGDIVNLLHMPQALNVSMTENTRGYDVSLKDDGFRIEIDTEEYECIEVYSGISESYGISGTKITNDTSEMVLRLKHETSIINFLRHYRRVVSFCQFLLFRSELAFTSVEIGSRIESVPYVNKAECHMRQKELKLKRKNIANVISFNLIKPEHLADLFLMMEKKESSQLMYNVPFIPSNDEDANVITVDKIKGITSAVETEIGLADIHLEKDVRFEKLKNIIKKAIKEHRNSEEHLDEKTYSSIFGSMKHWNEALSDSVNMLYELHAVEMTPVMGYYPTTKYDLEKFVKCRNDLTHGRYVQITPEIADTAMFLMALVYCCILSRAGISTEIIRDILKRRVLS